MMKKLDDEQIQGLLMGQSVLEIYDLTMDERYCQLARTNIEVLACHQSSIRIDLSLSKDL